MRRVWQNRLDLHYAGIHVYYPSLDKTVENGVVDASDGFLGFHFDGPLFVEVKIPVKSSRNISPTPAGWRGAARLIDNAGP